MSDDLVARLRKCYDHGSAAYGMCIPILMEAALHIEEIERDGAAKDATIRECHMQSLHDGMQHQMDCEEIAKLKGEVARLNAAIDRQSGAVKTLRSSIMAEVQAENSRLRDIDRSEYSSAATLESEREANSLLTSELEVVTARLVAALSILPQRPMVGIDAVNACLVQLDMLVADSGRGYDCGEEDGFRMGEWFEERDLANIEKAKVFVTDFYRAADLNKEGSK